MFYHIDQIKPNIESLARCARVVADGDVHKPKEMRDWAREHCDSFVWWEETDMSDVSSWTGSDLWVEFYFVKQEDATAFRLRWL